MGTKQLTFWVASAACGFCCFALGFATRRKPAVPPGPWQSTILPTMREAEELLDYLEARGYVEREFHLLGQTTFEVRWR